MGYETLHTVDWVTWCPPWKTGKYYSYPFSTNSNTATTPISWTNQLIFVPNPMGVIATSIGVEMTASAAGGTSMRFGIYTTGLDAHFGAFPDELVIDGGTVTIDATGYRSVSISQFLRQGWYFLSQIASTNSGTIRILSASGTIALFQGSPSQSNVIHYGSIIAHTTSTVERADLIEFGLPARFPMMNLSTLSVPAPTTNSYPRVILGI